MMRILPVAARLMARPGWIPCLFSAVKSSCVRSSPVERPATVTDILPASSPASSRFTALTAAWIPANAFLSSGRAVANAAWALSRSFFRRVTRA